MDKSDELIQEMENYWDYYLILEKDMLSIEQYVAFDNANLSTYSNQFLKLLQIICSEIDALLKKFCSFYGYKLDNKANSNMVFYKKTINKHYPILADLYVSLKKNKELKFQPWKNITENKKLTWWYDYTQIKHNRMGKGETNQYNYMKANLENTLNALAALFIIENELYMLSQKSKIIQYQQQDAIPLLPFSTLFWYNKIDINFAEMNDFFFHNIDPNNIILK